MRFPTKRSDSSTLTAVANLVVTFDTESRQIFALANSDSVPKEVKARATAIHEQLRVLCEGAIAALKRVSTIPDLLTNGQLTTFCVTLWDQDPRGIQAGAQPPGQCVVSRQGHGKRGKMGGQDDAVARDQNRLL